MTTKNTYYRVVRQEPSGELRYHISWNTIKGAKKHLQDMKTKYALEYVGCKFWVEEVIEVIKIRKIK